MTDLPDEGIRLNKYVSDSGRCSRREADRWISEGRVTLNGKPAELGSKVRPGDEVLLDGQPLVVDEPPVYVILNKPVGITCTTERDVEDNIIDYLDHPQRVFPIGRLDKMSEGLILLTNDGDIVNQILRAGNAHDKEYLVIVDKPVTDDFLEGMRRGVPMLGTRTRPCRAMRVGEFSFRVILTEGLNRQIRRMCEYFDYRVRRLQRIRIMHLTLDGLPVGHWRDLTGKELEILKTSLAHSLKTAQEGQQRRRSVRRDPPYQQRTGDAGYRLAENKEPKSWRRPARTDHRRHDQDENHDD